MQAVIVNAIYDALGRKGAGGTSHDKETARRWFEENGPDFQEVCFFAGFHPEKVRRAALVFIDAHEGSARRKRLPNPEVIAAKQRERLAL